MWVCVSMHHSSAAEKPPLLYISGFVRAVCLAALPRRQTLQASCKATLLALELFMMAPKGEREGTRGKKEKEQDIER